MPRARPIPRLHAPAGLLARSGVLAALLCSAPVAESAAATVADLAAVHRDGQTFVTWTAPPGAGWKYRVYAATSPITDGAGLAGATLLGAVGDSTWHDRRLTTLLGGSFAFRTDSAGPELTPAQGLFVATPATAASRWYAVTAELSAGGEDVAIAPGANSLLLPVAEAPAPLRPVYQRTLNVSGTSAEVFTLWTNNAETPFQPATASRPSLPYHAALVRGGAPPDHALYLRGHGRGVHFLATLSGGGPLDWRLSIDDWLPNEDIATFYFGYHEGYDPTAWGNAPPAGGLVRGYTHARVRRLFDWVLASFPVDPERVYAVGGSMGGSFATFLALVEPDRIAATLARVPKLDLADLEGSVLAPGTFFPLWGDPALALPCDAGMSAYQRMNAAWLAAANAGADVPPMLTFSGRLDDVVGWHEKPMFYDAVRDAKLAAWHFWDQRTHDGDGGFDPMQDNAWLRRFRRDRSFPALTNASCDSDYGDGTPATGDTLGSVNGFLEWDPAPVDLADRWEVRLATRSLLTRWGVLAAPESATVDVTPRRLQAFATAPGTWVEWSVKRLPAAQVVQSGIVQADALGRVTVPGVKVYAAGSWLRVKHPGPAGVPPANRAPGIALALDRAPLVGRGTLTVTWPGDGPARVVLRDIAGRTVRMLFQGEARGTDRHLVEARGLAAGVYVIDATQGTRRAARRLALLP